MLAESIGKGLGDLPDDKWREVPRLLPDEVSIDRGNSVNLTLGIPTESLKSIELQVSAFH